MSKCSGLAWDRLSVGIGWVSQASAGPELANTHKLSSIAETIVAMVAVYPHSAEIEKMNL